MEKHLFQYAVHDDNEVVVPISEVLAADEKEVRMIAARAIPQTHADKLGELEVVVRPFGNR